MICRLAVALCGLLITEGVKAAPPAWTNSCDSTETAAEALAGLDLSGKWMIYTGADGNLASKSTVALARAGASLILACRTIVKCDAVRTSILNQTGASSGSIETETLDLSSKASIRDFANRTIAKHPRIFALINSAGTYGTFITGDNLVGAMEINLLGPALLSHLLLPALRGYGRIVNVAAAAYGTTFTNGTTAKDLADLCTSVNTTLNQTGGYFTVSKFLMVHHAIELARREPTVAAVALAPGVAFKLPPVPTWFKHDVVHFPYPKWLLERLPKTLRHFIEACTENEAGLASCPETQDEGAAVIVAAASWPQVEQHSGVYLDFETKPLPAGAPNEYGPWVQADPSCVPREPDRMDPQLRSDWYDEMLRLMR